MADIQFINKNSAVSAAATGITVTKPTNTQEGDVMVAQIFVEDNTDRVNSVPADWVERVNYSPGTRAIRQYVYTKVAGASEPADYTWGINATDEIIGMISTYRGVDPADPVGNVATSTSTSSNDPAAPTINVQAANNAVIFLAGNAYGTTYTAPANYTEREDRRTGTGTSNISATMADRLAAPVGATGTVTGDAVNADYFVATLLELKALRVTAAGNIASAEAFGTAKLVGKILAAGAIASALAFGSPAVKGVWGSIAPPSISSAESVPSPGIKGALSSAGGIVSQEGFGNPALKGIIGPAGGIASAEVVPSPAVRNSPMWLCGGIASAEAFGTPTIIEPINITLAGDIASAEAFGTPKLKGTVLAAGGVASIEAFGNPDVGGTIKPSGISTAEVFGSATLVGMASPIKPSAIASAEAFGSHTLATGKKLCGGIQSAEGFGVPLVRTVNRIWGMSGVSSAEAFGNPKLNGTIKAAGGIASAESVEEPEVSVYDKKLCGAIPSAEAFGAVTLLNLGQGVRNPPSIPSAEAFGTPIVRAVSIKPTGIPSGEAVGIPWAFRRDYCGNIESEEAFGFNMLVGILKPGGIAEGAFGTPSLKGQIVAGAGAASAEAVGSPALVGIIRPSGIASVESFGTLKTRGTISPVGKASDEAFGSVQVFEALPDIIYPGAIYGAEAFGTAKLNGTIKPSSIASAEAFGSGKVGQFIVASGIATAEAFGTPTIRATSIRPTGINGAVMLPWGHRLVSPLRPGGIATLEVVPAPRILGIIKPGGIPSGEVFGTPNIGFIIAPSIPSAEAFGTPTIIDLGHPGVPCGSWAANDKFKYLGPKCRPIGPKPRRCASTTGWRRL